MSARVETGCGGNGTVIAGAGGGLCVTGAGAGSAVNLFGITSGGVGGDDAPFVVTPTTSEEQQ